MRLKGLSNAEVAKRFVNHQSGESKSMRTDGQVLYSYAEPIAVRVGNHILLNIDSWSHATSGHQGAVRFACHNSVLSCNTADISFRIMEQHGVDFHSSRVREMTSVLDTRPSIYLCLSSSDIIADMPPEKQLEFPSKDITYQNFEQILHKQFGTLGSYSHDQKREIKYFHLAGSCLLKVGISVFWASQEHGQYFIVEIANRGAHSIDDAVLSMMPDAIHQLRYLDHLSQVVRQGEYFFCPVGKYITDNTGKNVSLKSDIKKWYALTDRTITARKPKFERAHHVAKEAIEVDGKQFVRGYVIDAQHRKTMLPEPCWYQVHHNVCLRSISTNRRID